MLGFSNLEIMQGLLTVAVSVGAYYLRQVHSNTSTANSGGTSPASTTKPVVAPAAAQSTSSSGLTLSSLLSEVPQDLQALLQLWQGLQAQKQATAKQALLQNLVDAHTAPTPQVTPVVPAATSGKA